METERLIWNELADIELAMGKISKGEGAVDADRRKLTLEVWFGSLDSQSSDQLQAFRDKLEKTIRQIRVTGCRNAALIQSGQQYTSAMLEVFCPAQTYQPTGGGQQVPCPSIVSVNC